MIAFYNVHLVDEALDAPGAVLAVHGKIRAVFVGLFTNQATVAAAAQAVLLEDGYKEREVEYIDGKGLTLQPAFIDMHTHLRYPGQEQKEELKTALAAAAAGGYCTVVAMPNTVPVVSSAQKAHEIVEAAAKISPVKVIQAVSITRDFGAQDTAHLDELDAVSCPIISQDGCDVENSAALLDAMCKAANKGIVVSCHSEDVSLAKAAKPLREEALSVMRQNGLGPCGTDGFALDFLNKSDEESVTALDEWDDSSRPPLESTLGDDEAGDDIFDQDEGEEDDEQLSEDDKVHDKINALIATADTMLSLAETVAVMRNIELAKTAMCRVHIAHVSTVGALEAVRRAKEERREAKEAGANAMAEDALDVMLESGSFVPDDSGEFFDDDEKDERAAAHWEITCEVTPHHIALCSTDEPFNRALVNPPLGTEDDRLALIEGIRDGTVDVIATDHAPHTAADKALGAPGFVGLETAYAVCNTVLCGKDHDEFWKGQISCSRLSCLMSANPARILHLNKGRLAAGYDADLVLLDSEEIWTIDSKQFCSKGRATPFDGMEVLGRVKALYIAGKKC